MTIPDDFLVYLMGIFASVLGISEFYRRKVIAEANEAHSHEQIETRLGDVLIDVQKISNRLNEIAKQPNYTNAHLERDIKEIKQRLLENSPALVGKELREIKDEIHKMQETVDLLERQIASRSVS